MPESNQQTPRTAVTVAIIGGVFAVLAACVGLGLPIVEQLVNPEPIPTVTSNPPSSVSSAIPASSTATSMPVITSIPATRTPLPPTATSTHTPTPSPSPLPPTDTPSPQPTRTPTPAPGGIGTTVGDSQFQITLADYEYRSLSNESDVGAVEVTFQFENKTADAVPVVVDIWSVEGTDNLGIKYGEKHAVSARFSTFGFKGGWEEELRNYEFIVPPNDVHLLTFELQVEGDYDENTPTRVDIATDWIDLVFPSIRYRTDELNSLFGATWRLER